MSYLGKVWNRFLDKLLVQKVEELVQRKLLFQYSVFGAPERLKLHATAVVNNALFNTVSGSITVEELAFFGHSVSVLTGSHDPDATGIGRWSPVTSGRDIVIKHGAWIASNATILGPCIIGEEAVVGACSLVKNDVPARTIVAGVPARVIRGIQSSL